MKNFGSTSGLTILAEDHANPADGMVSYITSSYQTGYQNGDIKGAFLSDTDDTDLVGSGELVTNGTFDSDLSGWTDISTGTGTAVFDAGTALLTAVDSNNRGILTKAITTVPGAVYQCSIEITQDSGNAFSRIGTSPNGAEIAVFNNPSVGVSTITFMATGATTYITLNVNSGNLNFDNVSVKLADADRSVNNNGLIVNGTVTREPVAPGADLVAYSGFSTSNYLEQPYNPDLDFGAGDFCVMGWLKCPVDESAAFLVRSSNNGGNGFFWYITGSGSISTRTGSSGTVIERITNGTVDNNTWTQLVVLRKSGEIFRYLNGNFDSKFSESGDLNVQEPLQLGGGAVAMALWRISATAPTDEQIKKIYEDEKVLFQENAQATLYGTSDAVTALAHDEVTDLLHVGTSDGRSVFQGLRRVDNTTDPVNTAISAHNGLIVEG